MAGITNCIVIVIMAIALVGAVVVLAWCLVKATRTNSALATRLPFTILPMARDDPQPGQIDVGAPAMTAGPDLGPNTPLEDLSEPPDDFVPIGERTE